MPKIGNSGLDACLHKPVTSLSFYPKPKFCVDSSLIGRLSFFVLPVPHKFVSFSKRYKSCPIWPLLRFHEHFMHLD